MQQVESLRERKRLAARAALEKAALDLFNEKGFGRTTIDEIARAAEFSRSTFFRHFGSKEAVLFAAYQEGGEAFSRYLLARPHSEGLLEAYEEALVDMATQFDPVEQRGIAEARMRLFSSNPNLMARSREIVNRWETRIAETLARRDGLDKPERKHRVAAAVGVAISRAVSEEWSLNPDLDGERAIRTHFAELRQLCE